MRPRLTYANVVATLALVIAVGGGAAYAANTVFSSDIVDGQVKTADLDGGAVNSEKVADETLKGRDVFDNTLKGADIDESTLSSVAGGGAAGGDLTGTYPNPLIGVQRVNSAKVADGALTEDDLGAGSVGTSEIRTNGVGPSELQADSVSSDELVRLTQEINNVLVPSHSTRSALITCPTGTDVISGGGGTTGGIALVNSTKNFNGWITSAHNDTDEDHIVQVQAYCLEP